MPDITPNQNIWHGCIHLNEFLMPMVVASFYNYGLLTSWTIIDYHRLS